MKFYPEPCLSLSPMLSLALSLICLFLLVKLEADALTEQLSELFTPDDAFLFGPQSILEFDHNQMIAHSKKSLSFDGVCYLSSCFNCYFNQWPCIWCLSLAYIGKKGWMVRVAGFKCHVNMSKWQLYLEVRLFLELSEQWRSCSLTQPCTAHHSHGFPFQEITKFFDLCLFCRIFPPIP